MNTQTSNTSKPLFPQIQPDMLLRLTTEADQRSTAAQDTDWDAIKRLTQLAARRAVRT